MKIDFNTFIQQTQDFLLRLFVDSGSQTTPHNDSQYTCSHCGTFSRLNQ